MSANDVNSNSVGESVDAFFPSPASSGLSATRCSPLIDEHTTIVVSGEKVTVRRNDDCEESFEIGSPEAFRILSDAWLRSGWDTKYVYSFTWLGRPIIQLPEDMIRIQELVYQVKPDVIVECGIAHGGGLVFHASLCKMIGKGRVIGVDIEVRPHNKFAIEEHELRSLITLVEGNSAGADTIERVRSMISPSERVLVLLDSNHSKSHVMAELNAYAPLVSPGSYVVVMDGIMARLSGAPRSNSDWTWNNPRDAAHEFVRNSPSFQIVEPTFPFNEGMIRERVSYCPDAYLKRTT